MLGDYELGIANQEYKEIIEDLSPKRNQYNLLNDVFASNWSPNFSLLVNYIYLDEDERKIGSKYFRIFNNTSSNRNISGINEWT